jgi:hypothetical protein
MPEREFDSFQSQPPSETSHDTPEGFISIEALRARIESTKADEAAVLDMIVEAAGSVPVPAEDDPEATAEFDRIQTEIRKFAYERLGRSQLIGVFETWLEGVEQSRHQNN